MSVCSVPPGGGGGFEIENTIKGKPQEEKIKIFDNVDTYLSQARNHWCVFRPWSVSSFLASTKYNRKNWCFYPRIFCIKSADSGPIYLVAHNSQVVYIQIYHIYVYFTNSLGSISMYKNSIAGTPTTTHPFSTLFKLPDQLYKTLYIVYYTGFIVYKHYADHNGVWMLHKLHTDAVRIYRSIFVC
ncbi:hypothetical protein AX774_g1501 [Zancudomyces culisetae]|uniref:Uncharacterized protein n=1 Tax=Zancudomyces culisetae TaxID=1213189 RepID=A0A1R1PVL9_ZANCU|nr:hypothetical protein AX774_g1501 [Zancudomyces culisetae]|eukprot:OMH84969.1 hypothetical protein AX774_g1501 [Zancudomyces culisetae]